MYSFLVGFGLLVINSYLSKKKKKFVVRVIPYALSLKGLLGELPYITCGDNVMQEFTRTNLFMLILFSISYVMMSGLGSPASRMLLTTPRIEHT